MQNIIYPEYESEFSRLSACVLIPTYNNAQTLKKVILDVASFTKQIIVVNDGSTDDTPVILEQFPFIKVIQHTPNRGKGFALGKGFRFAWQSGYQYAITMDSDGQHFAHDLPAFLKLIEQQPQTLIIGARNMNQEHVPGKSSFGNKFSNFWFWVETGITLPDTQSGYRLYPLKPLSTMRFYSSKYEFEIEIPVRLSWKGTPVTAIPVSVYYPPAEERITHFRPFKDFTRISILNTFLTFTALLWIHPRNLVYKLSKKEGWRELWRTTIVRQQESNHKKAISIAFGIFMGIFPVWGFQLAIGIPLAVFFKMNKALFLLAANISIFPLTPIFWALSLLTGKIALGYDDWTFAWKDITLQQMKEAGIAFFLGGTILACVLALLSYLVSIIIFNLFRNNNVIKTK